MNKTNKKPRNKSKTAKSNNKETKNYIQFTKYGITTVNNYFKYKNIKILYIYLNFDNFFINI